MRIQSIVKRTLILSIIIFSASFCLAQTPDWYVPVYFNEKDPGVWTDNKINTFVVFKGELYVGGRFKTLNGSTCYNVGKLVGSSWVPIGKENDFWVVEALEVYHGELYAGGSFRGGGGVKKWNGVSWEPVGMTEYQPNNMATIVDGRVDGIMHVRTLKVYRDELYAGGGNAPNGKDLLFMKWNGKEWSSDGRKGPEYFGYELQCFEVFRDELYMICNGSWVKQGDTHNSVEVEKFHPLLKWDGTNYSTPDMVKPEGHKEGYGLRFPMKIKTLGDELYLSYNAEGLYKYNGKELISVSPDWFINNLVLFNNKFYFSGNMVDRLATYDDVGNIQRIPVPLDGVNAAPIIVFENKIYGGKMILNK